MLMDKMLNQKQRLKQQQVNVQTLKQYQFLNQIIMEQY
jgi:hypothetical protein